MPNTLVDTLIVEQDLAEVILLLDFISGRKDKNLSMLPSGITDKNGDKLTVQQMLDKVSTIQYPPESNQLTDADNAAFLLQMKDALNMIVDPAKGETIAYSLLFASAAGERKDGWVTSVRRFRKRSVGTPTDGACSRTAGGGAADGGGGSGIRGRNDPNPPEHRVHVAEIAYPNLIISALYFRRWRTFLAFMTPLLALFAVLCLAGVTYGTQVAKHFEQAKADESISANALLNEILVEQSGSKGTHTPPPNALCDLPEASDKEKVELKSSDPNTLNPKLIPLCNDYAYKHALLCAAIKDVGKVANHWSFRFVEVFYPIHELMVSRKCDEPETSPRQGLNVITSSVDGGVAQNATAARGVDVPPATRSDGRQEDAASVNGVLGLLSGYMLPILFGAVGTIASLLRTIQNKTAESLLSPRDRTLLGIRLILGIVAGACVGLFFSPSNSAASANVGTTIALSASGVAFLAGYGAEAFFGTLDKLLLRVFALSPGSNG